MESVRDLNMEADDMQVVLSALKGVNNRIKEVAQTHKPLFDGEHFLTGKEVCERLYITPAPCKTIGTTVPFLISSWVVRCCIVKVTWRLYCKDVITLLSVKRHRRRLSFRRIATPKGKQKKDGCSGYRQASVFFCLYGFESVAY